MSKKSKKLFTNADTINSLGHLLGQYFDLYKTLDPFKQCHQNIKQFARQRQVLHRYILIFITPEVSYLLSSRALVVNHVKKIGIHPCPKYQIHNIFNKA